MIFVIYYRNKLYIMDKKKKKRHQNIQINEGLDDYQNIKYKSKKEPKNLIKYSKPKNEKQKNYINYINDKNTKIIFAVGPAGTGKTMIACEQVIKQIFNKEINNIVLTRPLITNDEELGFLPGTINEKMDPWIRPINDIFSNVVDKNTLDNMYLNNHIEICPLAYMRGRTFHNTIIIADEMQNSTIKQMKMLLTRIGNNSKIILNGDLKQKDINCKSGLNHVLDKLKNNEKDFIKIIEFDKSNIERNPIISYILDLYDKN